MINNIVTINNEREITTFLDMMDNVDYLSKKMLNFDGTLLKLKLEGENFESSLTGSLIMALAKYQEKIYSIYLIGKYGAATRRKVTAEEERMLEIKVTINKGCTEVLIQLANKVILGAMNNMTSEQVQTTLFGLAGIVMGGVCLLGIGSKIVVETFKNKRKTLAQKRAQSKDEVEKRKIEAQESQIKAAIEAVREMGIGILQSGPSRVAINDKTVSTQNIVSVVEDLIPHPKPDVIEEQIVITGEYLIQRVMFDFKKNIASVDIFDVNTTASINGLVLQSKSISDGSYNVLKTAQNKQKIKMQIITTERNGRIHKAVLDKIL